MTVLKPQDLVVLLGLAARGGERFEAFTDVAAQTGLSPGEVHKSLQRSEVAGLYHSDRRQVVTDALREFLVGGVRYAFPAVRGAFVRGVPTGVAAPPLADAFAGETLGPEHTPVWPSPSGTRQGYGIEPLYRTVPAVAEQDAAFYELLALTDALREGRPRERRAAQSALLDRLHP